MLSAALAEVRAASAVRPFYGRETGRGLWLVGDEGVYLMPNTIASERTIVYARECDPTKLDFNVWWATKRATFGGDNGVEFISLEEIDRLIAVPPKPRIKPQYLAIDMTPERFILNVVWSKKPSKRNAL